MINLEWLPYSNEISRSRGVEAKTPIVCFKILPTSYGCVLRVYESYTGDYLRDFDCLNLEAAQDLASRCIYRIESKRNLGLSLKELLQQTSF